MEDSSCAVGYDSDDRGCIVGENVGKIVGVRAVVEDEVLELVGWDLLEEYGIEEAGGFEVDLSLFLEEGDVGGTGASARELLDSISGPFCIESTTAPFGARGR